jgi:hypothetical protein
LIGVSFNLADGAIVRLALPVADARDVAETLLEFLDANASGTLVDRLAASFIAA